MPDMYILEHLWNKGFCDHYFVTLEDNSFIICKLFSEIEVVSDHLEYLPVLSLIPFCRVPLMNTARSQTFYDVGEQGQTKYFSCRLFQEVYDHCLSWAAYGKRWHGIFCNRIWLQVLPKFKDSFVRLWSKFWHHKLLVVHLEVKLHKNSLN